MTATLRTVTPEEVLQIHERLVQDFAETQDPISPPGVRSIDLLQSAVGRQFTGIGGSLKYPDAISNASTLLYGLCNDHPFYNGNKRTALVAALVHLNKNKQTLFHTTQSDLYDLMIRVASHTIVGGLDKRARNPKPPVGADEEVRRIAKWIADRAAKLSRGERPISFRELRRILERFGYYLQDPRNNTIDVVRYVEEKRGWLPRKTIRAKKHVGSIGWPGENREVGIRELKRIRRMCRLCEEDGIDSDAFYDEAAVIDGFVNHYRSVLRRLARN